MESMENIKMEKGKNMELRNSGRKRRRGTWKTASVLAYCPFLSS
jgi:hypothetical protein